MYLTDERVVRPTTCRAWKVLIANGLAFCALSKGGCRALRDSDRLRRAAHAVTLTPPDDAFALKWEPGRRCAVIGLRRRMRPMRAASAYASALEPPVFGAHVGGDTCHA
jgi:hypothetical protein